jgi:hypothetical protein
MRTLASVSHILVLIALLFGCTTGRERSPDTRGASGPLQQSRDRAGSLLAQDSHGTDMSGDRTTLSSEAHRTAQILDIVDLLR